MKHRGTKIVATLGPASNSPSILRRLVREGVDVVRLNFSHGTHESHRQALDRLRAEARRSGRTVAVLADLQGPKIRTGSLAGNEPVQLVRGRSLVITTRRVPGSAEAVSTGYRPLPREVVRGNRILLDDGRLVVRVVSVEGSDIRTVVETGGWLGTNKGLSVPGVALSAAAVTAKDRRDLAFAVDAGVDYVALSFVRSARDLQIVRRAIRRRGADIPVVAKIERPEAIDNLDAVLQASDGVMIARGDLGVEMRPEQVPVLQKTIIDAAECRGIPAITATQMLESMMQSPRPTRAEAADVANAVLDGTDAVMLSGETAAGHYPVQTVQMMRSIILEAEASRYYQNTRQRARVTGCSNRGFAALCHAAVTAQHDAGAVAILVFTASGETARILSKLRPRAPLIAITADPNTCQRAALWWGVTGVLAPLGSSSDDLIRLGQEEVMRRRLVKKGRLVVMMAGDLPYEAAANTVKLGRLGAG